LVDHDDIGIERPGGRAREVQADRVERRRHLAAAGFDEALPAEPDLLELRVEGVRDAPRVVDRAVGTLRAHERAQRVDALCDRVPEEREAPVRRRRRTVAERRAAGQLEAVELDGGPERRVPSVVSLVDVLDGDYERVFARREVVGREPDLGLIRDEALALLAVDVRVEMRRPRDTGDSEPPDDVAAREPEEDARTAVDGRSAARVDLPAAFVAKEPIGRVDRPGARRRETAPDPANADDSPPGGSSADDADLHGDAARRCESHPPALAPSDGADALAVTEDDRSLDASWRPHDHRCAFRAHSLRGRLD
jgi:hypothetical protein